MGTPWGLSWTAPDGRPNAVGNYHPHVTVPSGQVQLGVPVFTVVPQANWENPHETGNRTDSCAASAVCRSISSCSRQRAGARPNAPARSSSKPRRKDALAWRLGLSGLGLRLSALGLLRLRLLSPGLRLLLSAIPYWGWGWATAAGTVTGNPQTATGRAGAACDARSSFSLLRRGDPAPSARVATGPHFWHGPPANLARTCETAAADPSVAARRAGRQRGPSDD